MQGDREFQVLSEYVISFKKVSPYNKNIFEIQSLTIFFREGYNISEDEIQCLH